MGREKILRVDPHIPALAGEEPAPLVHATSALRRRVLGEVPAVRGGFPRRRGPLKAGVLEASPNFRPGAFCRASIRAASVHRAPASWTRFA